MSANVLVNDGAESDLRSTLPPQPLHRNLIVRSAHSGLGACRLGLLLLALLSVSACAAESSSSVTAGPTPSRCEVAVTAPAPVESVGGLVAVTVTTAPECLWNASSALTWISGLTPTSGQGSGRVEFRVAANPSPSAREGEVAVNGGRARVVQAAAPAVCRYEVSPATQTVAVGGGEAVLTIVSTAGCVWTASTNANWLVATSATSGDGNGRVTYTIGANGGSDRVATITAGGQAVTVRQTGTAGPPACSYTLSAAGQAIGSGGGAGSPVTVTTSAGCAWTATSAVPWISITAGASGSGSGTVSFSVAANTGAARSGSLTIGDDLFVVTQAEAPPPSCSYSIAPQNQAIGAPGGTAGPVTVTTTANCNWSATSNVPWISVTAGGAGAGNGSVSLLVAANTGAARAGTVTIAGQSFQVDQAAAPTTCTYSIAPSAQSMAAAGGAGSPIAVTAPGGCAWAAASNASWLTITGAATGTGSGSVSFTAGANTGAVRSGTLTIAGQTFTVSQSAATVCSYSLNPTTASVSAAAGAGPAIAVTTGSTCTWTATPTQSWITITSGASGTGNGSVGFTVAANSGGARTGSITIGGQVFQVSQAAPTTCTYTISPTNASFSRQQADGNTINVTTASGCSWTSVSNVPWVTISWNPTGTGSNTTRYDVARNTGAARSGTLTVAGQTFTISQAAN